jgi:hypothetical protein
MRDCARKRDENNDGENKNRTRSDSQSGNDVLCFRTPSHRTNSEESAADASSRTTLFGKCAEDERPYDMYKHKKLATFDSGKAFGYGNLM